MSDVQVLLLLGTLFLLIGGALFGRFRGPLRRSQELRRTGDWTEGTVVDHKVSTSGGPSESRARIPVYAPVVTWRTADGRPMKTTARFSRPLDRTPPLDSTVTVVYDAEDPTRWALPDWHADPYRVLVAIGACFALVGVGLLVGAVVR